MADINPSFMCARDPSIISWNKTRHQLTCKQILTERFDEVTVTAENDEEQDSEHLAVYLRIKNTFKPIDKHYEFNNKELTCKLPSGSVALKNMREGDTVLKTFKFSKIYGPDTNQTDLFNSIVKKRMLDFINGRSGTLLTYGASGAGKTYTIVGTENEPGIIPRAFEYLFKTLPAQRNQPLIKPTSSGDIVGLNDLEQELEEKRRLKILHMESKASRELHKRIYTNMQQRLSGEPSAIVNGKPNCLISVWVSFAEIYNENIYDLLLPHESNQREKQPRKPLKLRRTPDGNYFIQNLTNINVCSGLQAFQILEYGLQYLQYASTLINSHSSRSHSIFSIKLAQISADGEKSLSTINFCDLAGSERLKKTLNIGDRLKESNNINTSLMILHKCIKFIRDSQKFKDAKLIPFRESKLTQLFQKPLMGSEDVCMIVNINPDINMFDETQHVLSFSSVASDIIVKSQEVVTAKQRHRMSILLLEAVQSTIIGARDDSEKHRLEELVEQLQNEIFEQNCERELKEEELKDEMQSFYKNHIEQLKSLHNKKIKELTKYYEEQLAEYKRNTTSDTIVILDDSDSENKEEYLKTIEDLKKEIVDNMITINDLNEKLCKFAEENDKLKREIIKLRESHDELQDICDYQEEKLNVSLHELENLNNAIEEEEEDVDFEEENNISVQDFKKLFESVAQDNMEEDNYKKEMWSMSSRDLMGFKENIEEEIIHN